MARGLTTVAFYCCVTTFTRSAITTHFGLFDLLQRQCWHMDAPTTGSFKVAVFSVHCIILLRRARLLFLLSRLYSCDRIELSNQYQSGHRRRIVTQEKNCQIAGQGHGFRGRKFNIPGLIHSHLVLTTDMSINSPRVNLQEVRWKRRSRAAIMLFAAW